MNKNFKNKNNKFSNNSNNYKSSNDYYNSESNYNNNNNYNEKNYNYNNNHYNNNQITETNENDQSMGGNFYYNRKKGYNEGIHKKSYKNQNKNKREYYRENPNEKHYNKVKNEETKIIKSKEQLYNEELAEIAQENYYADEHVSKEKLLDIRIKEMDRDLKEDKDDMMQLIKNTDIEKQEKLLKDLTKPELKNNKNRNALNDENILSKIIKSNATLKENPELLSSVILILEKKLSSEMNSNQSIVNNSDINIIKKEEEEKLSEELINLLGYESIETVFELIQNRKEINSLVLAARKIVEDTNKENASLLSKNNTNLSLNSNITFEKIEKGKNRALKDKEKQLSNLKVLLQLGFDSTFLKENSMLGLHEKKVLDGSRLYDNSVNNQIYNNSSINKSNTYNTKYDPNMFRLPKKKGDNYVTTQTKNSDHILTTITPVFADRESVELINVSIMPNFARSVFDFNQFNQIQSSVFNKAFNTDDNLLICAPTGAGKTNIALLTILKEVNKIITSHCNINNNNKDSNSILYDSTIDYSKVKWGFKAVYLAPLKALANEVVDKFKSTLGKLNIKISEFSADVNLSKEQIDKTQIFVAIPEKWDLFTRKNEGIFTSLKLMIIDEVHLLNEERGRVLECIVARTLRRIEINQSFTRIVGLSATLPNYNDVASFLNVNHNTGLFYFDSSYRATPLEMKFLGAIERKTIDENKELENELAFEEIVKYLDMKKQVLVFVHSRFETTNFAKKFILLAQENGRSDLLKPSKKANYNYFKFANKLLEELAPYGVGFHNAGLLRKDRNTVENMFANKNLNLLVSTSTLAWGVNLPAYAVIIKGTEYYDSSQGKVCDIGILDIQQMFGRAGRPQFDNKGVAVIISPSKKSDKFISLLKNQTEIESTLFKFIDDALNAEIAIGNILNIHDAINWLKLTYLSVRMQTNPYAYNNLTIKDFKFLTHFERLQEVAEGAFDRLNNYKLIRYNKQTNNVISTELGRIACKYYLSSKSVYKYYENLNENMMEDALLKVFAESEEFSNFKLYPDETKELEALYERFMQTTTNKNLASTEKSITLAKKPIILLMAHLQGSYEFKNSSLYMDANYVADNSTRIMRAIVEISLYKKLVTTSILALYYVKSVEKRVPIGRSPLYQFTYISATNFLKNKQVAKVDISNKNYISLDLIKKVESISSLNIEELLYEDKLILSKMLNTSTDRIYEIRNNFLQSLPKFKVTIDYQPLTRTILNVTITLDAIFKWRQRWNQSSEPLWIIVSDGREIIHYEYFIFSESNYNLTSNYSKKSNNKNHSSNVINFSLPFKLNKNSIESIDKCYTFYIISDRWLGVEYTQSIYLNDIEVPSEEDVHTELLDLVPLPIKALQNEEYEKLFKFKFFNPIQTQIFYSCYNTDTNMLVGAPTGSGKTVVAELAILRTIKNNPLSKVIYIAPLKALAKERIKDWSCKMKLINKKVMELTGDSTPEIEELISADILITTPEKWDGISRNWQTRDYVQRAALMIIDEIHLLGVERGSVLEVIVSRMRYISSKTSNSIRFVGLSTALANSYDVGAWLGINDITTFNFNNNTINTINKINNSSTIDVVNRSSTSNPQGLYNFKPAIRPCPVTIHIEGFSEKFYCPRMGTMNKPAYNSIKDFSPNKPVLIFVTSRRQTRLTALDIISFAANEGKNFLWTNKEEISTYCELIKDDNLKHTLFFGVGLHHAGLSENDKNIVEELYASQKIQVLVATQTVAWGVNFPTHLVIIKGTEHYDPKKNTFVQIPITDVLQMIGRAGRPQFDDSAVACLFVMQEKKNFFKRFLYEPFPLESSLHLMLHDHINAEIATGTITNKKNCIEYITWTYFFRRLLKNPGYYGLKSVSSDSLNKYLNNMITSVLNDLANNKCILYDGDNIEPTNLGYLCSFYYTSHKSAKYLSDSLTSNLDIKNILEILSESEEFSQIPVRHNEDNLNEALAKLLPIEEEKKMFGSAHVKTKLLLQAHFSRIPMPISDYITDLKSVLDNTVRLLLFMIEVSSSKGLLDTTINIIIMGQMICQGIWPDESSIKCLGVNEFVLNSFSKNGYNHIVEVINYYYTKINCYLDKSNNNFKNEEFSKYKSNVFNDLFRECNIYTDNSFKYKSNKNKDSLNTIDKESFIKTISMLPNLTIKIKLYGLNSNLERDPTSNY